MTGESISEFMNEAVRRDEEIKKILDSAGVTRAVTSRDRDCYRTWTYTWKMPLEVILYASTLSRGCPNPIAYLGSVLGSWYNAGVTDLASAKAYKGNSFPKTEKAETTVTRSYTADQLNSLFDNLDYKDL